MSALPGLAVNLPGRQELCQQQDYSGKKPLGRIVEKRILPVISTVTIRADDGLGEDLGVLLRLGPRRQIVWVGHRLIHVCIYQRQEIEPI